MKLMRDGYEFRDNELDWLTLRVLPGWRKAEPNEDGTFSDESEEIKFGISVSAGFEIERLANKGLNRAERRKGVKVESNSDGTLSFEHLAKIIKRVEGIENEDGTPVEKVDVNVIRGLSDWMILAISEHIQVVKDNKDDEEKN